MSDLKTYRAQEREQERSADLIRLIPKGRRSLLDIGARDGHFSRLFTEYFDEVVALDLQKPKFEIPGVQTVAGDITNLNFPDNSFDCVFCAEVLEHIPQLARACKEMIRVAKHEIVVGVPFRQDTRCGRTTCGLCGKTNPPWGHVNSFTEERLLKLFNGTEAVSRSFVSSSREATNSLSATLMKIAGHPWGTYQQDEPCIHCGAKIGEPQAMNLGKKVCAALALQLDRVQMLWTRPHGNWIHLLFSKPGSK